jgi:hypothetical protein
MEKEIMNQENLANAQREILAQQAEAWATSVESLCRRLCFLQGLDPDQPQHESSAYAQDQHLDNLDNDQENMLADTEGEPNWQLFLLEVENFLIHKELENGYPSLEQALSTWRKSLQSTDLKKDFLQDNPDAISQISQESPEAVIKTI